MTTTNATIGVQCEWIKITPLFLVRSAKIYIFFGVLQNFLVVSLCVQWDEEGWKSLLYSVEQSNNYYIIDHLKSLETFIWRCVSSLSFWKYKKNILAGLRQRLLCVSVEVMALQPQGWGTCISGWGENVSGRQSETVFCEGFPLALVWPKSQGGKPERASIATNVVT